MRVLVVSLLYPLPTNVARGTFVSDHVELLKQLGHEVKVINPLPRMLTYQESRRSTLTGVAKAPKIFTHGDTYVYAPRFWGLPGHPYPSITQRSMKNISKKAPKFLGDWKPDLIVCHTIWPVGELADKLAKSWSIPWIGVVHGHDFDIGLQDPNISNNISSIVRRASHIVTVSDRLKTIGEVILPDKISTIKCDCVVEGEWQNKIKNWRGRWRKDQIDILFPADPRRPEKNHYLALQTGEELERRGWKVGITTLRQQPRSIVWDRMLVADLTLITSKRESGPLVARESIACGTPTVSVNVGDVGNFLPGECVVEQYDPVKLADACEKTLQKNWEQQIVMPEIYETDTIINQWSSLIASLVE